MCVCGIFFVLSSTDGRLGCSHTLDFVNNAAMNMEVYIFFGVVLFSSDKYPEVEWLDHVVVLFSIF